jgi:AcrR family transcriptional regulator
MPPKPKFTKEQIVECALGIARDSGVEAITAQEVGSRLGTSTRPMFTYFGTVEDLREAATASARDLYDSYAEEGLGMTPAFKGYAMAYIRFAAEEPSLFRLLFMHKAGGSTLVDFLDREGHYEQVLQAVEETFGLERDRASWLYENLWLYAHGIATVSATEVVSFTEAEISEKLGTLCHAMLMCLHAPADDRTSAMPAKGKKMKGGVDTYVEPAE